MSATNRGTVRNPRDYYATPKSAFEPLLPFLAKSEQVMHDPAAGDGRLVVWMRDHGLSATGADIEVPRLAKVHLDTRDFLLGEDEYCTIVTNPPFSLAFEFCQESLAAAREVYLLLRLNFLGSAERREWFQANEPNAIFVLSDRPSFTLTSKCFGCGWSASFPPGEKRQAKCPSCGVGKLKHSTSDACEYGWFYWGRKHQGIRHL